MAQNVRVDDLLAICSVPLVWDAITDTIEFRKTTDTKLVLYRLGIAFTVRRGERRGGDVGNIEIYLGTPSSLIDN